MRLLSSGRWTLPVMLLTSVLAGGCAVQESPEGGDTRAVEEPSSSAPATTEPTDPETSATAVPTGPEPSPTATTGTASGLESRLLAAGDLPGVNDSTVWEEGDTAGEDGVPHGTCQKASLVDIGADKSVVRTYFGGQGVTALQVVGEFADAKSAWRAHQVVRAWNDQCAHVLDADVEKVGRPRPVPLDEGVADALLIQYGDDGEELHTFAGVAITRVGRYLSLVQIDVMSQDYNYEPGQEPATLAAVAAAAPLR